MRGTYRKIASVLALALTLFNSGPASACAFSTPPQIADAGKADLVFIGELTEIKIYGLAVGASGQPLPYGLYDFAVTETLRGENRAEWKILWWVNPLGSNTKIAPGDRVIVTAMQGEAALHALAEEDAGKAMAVEASQFIIQEPACSSAPIFADTPETRAAIGAILAQTDGDKP